VPDGIGSHLDADHPVRHLGEQGRAIPFPGGNVDHILASAEQAGKAIPVEVLVLDLAMGVGGHSFAGKL